ncbi:MULTISPECIES: metallophosphoesterase family protein [unclassified Fusibacter]|uniref:metallophosphoesterase family protein n=1 Tax=unclassified Fusibacter TaxID=2624464 RepID=UPI001010658D|nr:MULTISPECIES: metallophosphoesterase family protein [unclassified Fusibacter]MCK8059200.1 metallophosphoesterase family protein [Fusibacter sp. A2]NPE21338.1 metallophosphoesterase [Fusibacter sp. A1]RXV62599.1 metallophosphoesterase [Fusibacter sp. A1]
MKILLISDEESPILTTQYFKSNLQDISFVISCGDLKSSYLEYIASISNLPIYYVHGNHDEHYIKTPPGGCISIDDQLITTLGLNIAGIGGCRRYRKGEFQYTDFQMWLRYFRMLPRILIKGVDILVTHAPAYELGDQPDQYVHRGFKVFNRILKKHAPKYHFHGHNHLNYGRQPRQLQFENTTIINGFKHTIVEIK